MNDTAELIAEFSSGSCTLRSYDAEANTVHVVLRKENDAYAVHSFSFTLRFTRRISSIVIEIDNAGDTQYARAWPHHVPWVRAQGDWRRTDEPATFASGRLRFPVPVEGDTVSVAWYPSYDLEDIKRFVDSNLGDRRDATIERQPNGFTVLRMGNRRAPAVVVIARQHPGESIGSFVLQGFLERLLSNSEDARRVLDAFHMIAVPVVNVDGVRQSLHRHDPEGRDLNRSWTASPEPVALRAVKNVLSHSNDVFAFIDVHGDEVSTVNFINYSMGRRVGDPRKNTYRKLLAALAIDEPKVHVWQSVSFPKRFVKALVRQRKIIRPTAVTANSFVARHYQTLSLTVEPSVHLLTPAQAAEIGAGLVAALGRVAGERDEQKGSR
jgi:hypothetical protein